MADHVDTVSNALVSQSIFNVKEEECQDNSEDDKVDISETSVVYNAGLQDHIWQDKIKQYELLTTLGNIKTEFSSSEASQVQNDSVKMEQGISSDDLKTEFENGMLYCEYCEAYYEDYCIKCGMLVHILNKNTFNSADKGARADIPNDILDIQDCFEQTGIYATRIIPVGVKFGPFTGLSARRFPWEMEGEKFVLDRNKSKYLNWMQYVNPTRNTSDHNLRVIQCEDNIYYQSNRVIQAGEELLVYFGDEYANNPNNIVRLDFVTIKKDIIKDVYACTFCCLGFSSKSHLAKHKTLCVEDTARKFSIEELMQCPFCKIQLDPKEYFEHHMSFCCDRNARKCVLPTTPSTKQTTTARNGRKKCLWQIYKCGQCKCRTKYQADLKKHTNIHHYKVKMYNYGVCNERFKTKESLGLHVENTHAYVGGKDNQEHPMTIYKNSDIEQSMSFRRKYKQSLRRHIKDKHLKQPDYKCDKCEYGTNFKSNLKVHLRTKHTKEFDFKCDSCEFRTNNKYYLGVHIKTKHTKEFDFKCDSCEFKTNQKNYLKVHIKTRHLRQFDYKCDSCEFRTNGKSHLEVHIKGKHLKKFDFKCDTCEYRSNNKYNLEVHIKGKHTKEFDFKCDSCEYQTNEMKRLMRHTKTTHLKEFSHRCEQCDYKTNSNHNLTVHVNCVHLKERKFMCHLCDFKAGSKSTLLIHIRGRHVTEYDYKCEVKKCKFQTNNKSHLNTHMKTKHTKECSFVCDECEFKSKYRTNLYKHVKSVHLHEFQLGCESCGYRTNDTSKLKRHIKSKHRENIS